LAQPLIAGAQHEGGLEAAGAGRGEVAVVGRHQAKLFRTQPQHVGRAQVSFGRRFIGPGRLCAEDGVPWQTSPFRHVDHQANVAVRQGGDDEAGFEPGQPFDDVRPWIEAMPGQIERVQFGRRD
jgi:hypothetical protein